MDTAQVIIWMILGCVFFVMFMAFDPFKKILRVVIRAALGCIGFWAVNMLLAPMGVSVGSNPLTGFIVGLLGAPGFVLLYGVQFLCIR